MNSINSISRIRILDNQTINKIAAGEVIENPASVVKELIENSIDAQATSICIEIQEGRELIRITDNGYGMSTDDALLCLERHATSKIQKVEDIDQLITMGFRGEAIPSIASISKFSILTSQMENKCEKAQGTILKVEGGKLLSCSSAACSKGTMIEVKSLFFNVPVRRKFQKSPSLDVQEILKKIGCFIFAFPKIHFEFISDRKLLLKSSNHETSNSSHELLKKNLESIYGIDFVQNLIPLKFDQKPFFFEGFIGIPTFHKPNKTGQHIFVNQRFVNSPFISSSIKEGYGTLLPQNRYPIFVLHIQIPNTLFDVNVHPQKKEIRLRQEKELKEAIMNAIQSSIQKTQHSMHTFSPNIEFSDIEIPPAWNFSSKKNEFFSKPDREEFKPKEYVCSETIGNYFTEKNKRKEDIPFLVNTEPSYPRVLETIVGYCLLDPFTLNDRLCTIKWRPVKGGIAFLDQKSANARILFDNFLLDNSKNEIQNLLIPITMQLNSQESSLLNKQLLTLNEMGMSIREIGNDSFLVDAFPSFLKEIEIKDYILSFIHEIQQVEFSTSLDALKKQKLALAACRASIPIKHLSKEEGQVLLEQLMKCEFPAQCPFGKPTCIYISPEELVTWFSKNITQSKGTQ